MNEIIKALVITTAIQIISMLGMAVYMSDRAVDQAKYYAAELVRNVRNDTQMQFSQEREQLKDYIDRSVQNKVNQAIHQQSGGKE